MDPTTQAALAALVGAIIAGGAVLAWHVSDRQRTMVPHMEAPVVPPGVDAVLSVLRSSAIVVDESGGVAKASAPAYAFGLVRGTELLVDELRELVAEVRRDGQIRETELVLRSTDRSTARTLTARVAPLGSRLVLALVEDRTREKRIEAVRRDFVANISHELKTPVGAIRLLAEAVEEASDDPEAVHRFASRMLTESDRLATLVQQVIELSRLQARDPLEAPVAVDIDEAISAAIDASAIEAATRRITVTVQGDSGLEVVGSAEQVGAAVSNLVANAVHYSDEDSTVVVTTRATADDVEISVVDQGIGIPKAELDRIFERFYRVDPARHRSTGGTGLGLAIVKHVAAVHGGDVKVWSLEGQGSTFTLTLPQSIQPGIRLAGPPSPTPGPEQQQEVRR